MTTFDGCAGLQPMLHASSTNATAMSFFIAPILEKRPTNIPYPRKDMRRYNNAHAALSILKGHEESSPVAESGSVSLDRVIAR
jgi:hypothetical protein